MRRLHAAGRHAQVLRDRRVHVEFLRELLLLTLFGKDGLHLDFGLLVVGRQLEGRQDRQQGHMHDERDQQGRGVLKVRHRHVFPRKSQQRQR